MAIYRKGTASVDAAGKMTGTGTDWMQALSLIRVGATVILLSGSKPVIGSIAEIISDTEINLIGTAGQTAVSGDYVILLSDSLTVDGLAQDIAETLRYYQSKETAVDGLIDSIKAYLKRAEDSASAAKTSETNAGQKATDAAASASAAKTSETNAGQKATDAAASASAAKTSETNAGQKATDAAASASAAKTSETNAANTLSGAVLKSQNLKDLADKASGWTNLLTARSAATARSDLGLGNSSTRNVGSASGTVAAGDDGRLNTINGKSGGNVSSSITLTGVTNDPSGNASNNLVLNGAAAQWNVVMQYWLQTGQYHSFRLVQNNAETFRAQSNGSCFAASFNPTSDSNLKFNKNFISNALEKSMMIRGMTYNMQGQRKAGVIAQDVESVIPEAVTTSRSKIVLEDGTILDETKSLDYSGVAGLHSEAIKDVVKLMLLCLEDPDAAKSELKGLVSKINSSNDDENKTKMKMEWALADQPEINPNEINEPEADGE